MHTIYESFGTRIFFVQSLVFRWCLSFMFVFWLLGYEISVWGWRVKLLKHFCNYECGTRGQSILRDAISWNMGVLYLRHLPHAGVSTQFLIPPFSGFFPNFAGCYSTLLVKFFQSTLRQPWVLSQFPKFLLICQRSGGSFSCWLLCQCLHALGTFDCNIQGFKLLPIITFSGLSSDGCPSYFRKQLRRFI